MTKTETTHSPAKKSRPGVCAYMAELILSGMDDTDEILKRVHRKFRESRATKTDVGIIKKKVAQGRYDHLKGGAKPKAKTPPVRRRAKPKKPAK